MLLENFLVFIFDFLHGQYCINNPIFCFSESSTTANFHISMTLCPLWTLSEQLHLIFIVLIVNGTFWLQNYKAFCFYCDDVKQVMVLCMFTSRGQRYLILVQHSHNASLYCAYSRVPDTQYFSHKHHRQIRLQVRAKLFSFIRSSQTSYLSI